MPSFVHLPGELVSAILSLGTMRDILLSFQLVNKQFLNVIRAAPEVLKKLTFMPSDEVLDLDPDLDLDIDLDHSDSSVVDWMDLSQRFPTFTNVCSTLLPHHIRLLDGSSTYLILKLSWADHDLRSNKWLRKDASWRKFLVRSYNQTVVTRLNVCSRAFDDIDDDLSNSWKGGFIEFGNQNESRNDGLTFGDLYDLVTIPELGLFSKGWKHDLVWQLRFGETTNKCGDAISNQARIYLSRFPDDSCTIDWFPKSCNSSNLVEDFAVQGRQSIIDSGRLNITWRDD